jgi:hypothetical protein
VHVFLLEEISNHTIRKVKENKGGSELNGTQLLLLMLIYWVKTYHKEKTHALLDTSKEFGLEVNTKN